MEPTESSEISIDETSDYRFEALRLQSFETWTGPTVNRNFIKVLAAAGFYYTGESDKAKCFDCQVEISNWDEDKDPLMEHKRRSPSCRFVRMRPCGDVSIGVDPKTIPSRAPKMNEICKLEESEVSPDTLDKRIEVYFEDLDLFHRVKIGDLMGACYPDFAIYERRLDTFLKWPGKFPLKDEDLAAAGFICANNGVLTYTYCFHCNGVITRWESYHNPVKEHSIWFPNCKFIQRFARGEAEEAKEP
ncbi:e3 ubiquitin-protein ligase iap-3-like protein [Lasius niger]|uniref:E3 ubiquitin-protein ligase iap-3-like protein n=1 Tax=Lasius niger TaxID=67767 RepID=A0A0J7L1B6_LASNI|nr:e3 ubiquitin-protein ligase iap-3-like protein [Lasius niger]